MDVHTARTVSAKSISTDKIFLWKNIDRNADNAIACSKTKSIRYAESAQRRIVKTHQSTRQLAQPDLRCRYFPILNRYTKLRIGTNKNTSVWKVMPGPITLKATLDKKAKPNAINTPRVKVSPFTMCPLIFFLVKTPHRYRCR